MPIKDWSLLLRAMSANSELPCMQADEICLRTARISATLGDEQPPQLNVLNVRTQKRVANLVIHCCWLFLIIIIIIFILQMSRPHYSLPFIVDVSTGFDPTDEIICLTFVFGSGHIEIIRLRNRRGDKRIAIQSEVFRSVIDEFVVCPPVVRNASLRSSRRVRAFVRACKGHGLWGDIFRWNNNYKRSEYASNINNRDTILVDVWRKSSAKKLPCSIRGRQD